MGKAIRIIFGIPYSIYSYSVYFVTLVMMFLASICLSLFFSKEKASFHFFGVLKAWSSSWMFLSLIRYRFVDRQNYAPQTPYVMVSNHFSFLDMMIGAVTVYPNVRVLAKAEIKKVPFFSKLFKMSSVFVDRKSKESRERSRIELTDAISSGKSIWIFPEGTRNRSKNPLKEFYDGAFKIAIEQQVPILPVVSTNSRFINRMDSMLLLPGKFEVRFLKPVDTKGMTEDDVPALRDKVYAMMENCIAENDRWFKKRTN